MSRSTTCIELLKVPITRYQKDARLKNNNALPAFVFIANATVNIKPTPQAMKMLFIRWKERKTVV